MRHLVENLRGFGILGRGESVISRKLGHSARILVLIAPVYAGVDRPGRIPPLPGFIEGHGDFLGLGQSKMNLNLSGPLLARDRRDSRGGQRSQGRCLDFGPRLGTCSRAWVRRAEEGAYVWQ